MDILAKDNEETLRTLRSKHPSDGGQQYFDKSSSFDSISYVLSSKSELQKAISSFANGSAHGLDGQAKLVKLDEKERASFDTENSKPFVILKCNFLNAFNTVHRADWHEVVTDQCLWDPNTVVVQ
ncbi:hypothetical protein ACOME3_000698 [Neoechinorhynchus agilis]